jgi:hypothetical protein
VPYLSARSLPLLCARRGGQEVTFLMPMLALARVLLDRGRNFAAGVSPSPCAMKFPLFRARLVNPT